MIDRVRSVDFVCRGGKETEVKCVSLLDTVMSLWRDMLDRYSQGTDYETEYLSRKHLEEHKELKQVAAYAEEKIQKAVATGEGANAVVRQVVGDDEVVESLGDLLVVRTEHSNVTVTSDMKMNVLKELGLEETSHFSQSYQAGKLVLTFT